MTMNVNTTRENKGIVIITVLWTVVVLVVMVAILERKGRLDMKVSAARVEGIRCKWACLAGIEKAMAVLKEDETENDSAIDVWSSSEEDFNDIPVHGCWFNVRVTDETSKLNINTATREQLLGLPNMLEDVADAIIDWRDTDDVPGTVGVESGYYENLPYLYTARNAPFRTIRELLLVKGVTEDLFYGEDTNLNGRLDYNERDGNLSPPMDDGDDILDVGWAAYLTCYPTGTSQTTSNQTQDDQSQGSQNQDNQGQTSQNQSSQSNQNQGSQNQGSQNQGNQNQGNQNQGNQSQGNRNQGNQSQGNQSQGSQNQQSQNQSSQNQNNQNQNNQNQSSQNQQNQQNDQSSSTQTYAKVNINTASDIVLAALFGGGEQAERNAQAIVNYRDSLTEGIQDPSELVSAAILDQSTYDQIQNYITTRSDIFMIRCVATADRNGPNGATLVTEAVVDRSQTPCKVLFWYEGGHN
jgi:type II secretory pathway component PulK